MQQPASGHNKHVDIQPSSLSLPLQGTSARILETRKTAPGLRLTDKWAVLMGGGNNHRIGLFDMVMIKDNHVTAAGGVVPAIQHAQVCDISLFVIN